LSSTRPANHDRVEPASDSAGQPLNRLFERFGERSPAGSGKASLTRHGHMGQAGAPAGPAQMTWSRPGPVSGPLVPMSAQHCRGDQDDRQFTDPPGRHRPQLPGLPGVPDEQEEQAKRGARGGAVANSPARPGRRAGAAGRGGVTGRACQHDRGQAEQRNPRRRRPGAARPRPALPRPAAHVDTSPDTGATLIGPAARPV